MEDNHMNNLTDLNLERLRRAKDDITKEYLKLVRSENYDPEHLAQLHERQWEAERAYARATRKVGC
jgi:hypothetical protein